MTRDQWVRLSKDVDCGLRRGGWYEAVEVRSTEVVLSLRGRAVTFPRELFEVSEVGPTHWTVVSRAGNAVCLPALWARGYAVCPSCRWRQLVLGRPKSMLCEGCYREFDINWEELYLKVS